MRRKGFIVLEKFLDFIDNEQLAEFFKWCIEYNMMANITNEDLEDYYEYQCLPLLTNNGITIGIDIWENGTIQIGIDPTFCFDKTSKCSIIAMLPLSKRETNRFYKLLGQVIDKKSNISKKWFKEAPACWFGSFASFS